MPRQVGTNVLNLLLAAPAPQAWLFLDPGAIGAFSACWACCVARRLSRRAPKGWLLGAQPGVTLARLDPAVLRWAVGIAQTTAVGANASRRRQPATPCTCLSAAGHGRAEADLTVLVRA